METTPLRNYSIKIGVLIVFMAFPAEGGQAHGTLNVDFTKVKSSKSGYDTINGNLHWFENRMVIKVTAPIVQFMSIDSLQTIIYNPMEQKGIRINRKTAAFLPFFNTFIGFFKGEQVVPQANFTIRASVKKNDSLYTEWGPDGNAASFRGKFETVFYRDKPIRATTYDKKGNLLYRMSFGHDTLIDGAHIPLRISTQTQVPSGSMFEDVEFRNISINQPIPSEITNFKIPAGVPIKVLE